MATGNTKDFLGKVVLITGAASGIARTTAVEFARQGATLSLIDINDQEETIKMCKTALVGLVPSTDDNVLKVTGDISKVEVCNKYIANTVEKFGKIDVLVNCAGILREDSVLYPNVDYFDQIIAVNLRSMYNLCTIAAPYLIKTKGNIVNISSSICDNVYPNYLSYSISKAGVSCLTKHIAADLQPHGVRVNGIKPGGILTSIVLPSELKKYSNWGRPEQIASVVLFLASSKASIMTGSNVLADGGFEVLQNQQK